MTLPCQREKPNRKWNISYFSFLRSVVYHLGDFIQQLNKKKKSVSRTFRCNTALENSLLNHSSSVSCVPFPHGSDAVESLFVVFPSVGSPGTELAKRITHRCDELDQFPRLDPSQLTGFYRSVCVTVCFGGRCRDKLPYFTS